MRLRWMLVEWDFDKIRVASINNQRNYVRPASTRRYPPPRHRNGEGFIGHFELRCSGTRCSLLIFEIPSCHWNGLIRSSFFCAVNLIAESWRDDVVALLIAKWRMEHVSLPHPPQSPPTRSQELLDQGSFHTPSNLTAMLCNPSNHHLAKKSTSCSSW